MNDINSGDNNRDTGQEAGQEKGSSPIIRVVVITGIVLIILFGLYWGGRKFLLAPTEKAFVDVSGICTDIRTDTKDFVLAFFTDNEQVCGLDVSGKSFHALTKGVGQVKSLTYLDLSDNVFKEVPEWIGDASNLQYLDLSNNRITSLPLDLGKLNTLKLLDLTGNPIDEAEVNTLKKLLANTTVKF